MTRSKAAVQEEVSPNLIPMVDIMFLLLLFFMLSADMGQRQLEDVKLPDARMSQKPPEGGKNDQMTINVYHDPKTVCATYTGQKVCREDRHWKTAISGHDFRDTTALTAYLQKVAPREKDDARRSPQRVMIRSDRAAPYGLAQRAMNACAETGIYKIEVGAALPEEKKKRS